MKSIKTAFLALAACFAFAACSDDDNIIVGDITSAESETTKTIAWDEVEATIEFTANTTWEATASDVASRAGGSQVSWLKLTVPSGEAGTVRMPVLFEKNDNENYRDATITIRCGEKMVNVKIHQEANPDAVHIMDKAQIPNYDKYYCPQAWNPNFEKGPDNMLRDDATWSWWRMKQSEHFFVFWEPGFGSDPNSPDVPTALRVDIDELLAKAEQFYKTNVETLKMCTVGKGKSQLDKYKMQIYLLYQNEWLATGSGYDNVIGALWVNPSTCKPVGSTIAHEIGHSFQFQAGADRALAEGHDGSGLIPFGFRYGFGPNGEGGCAYWEQCAQWQAFQDYPEESFTQGWHIDVWMANHHRHYDHEFMRYASYWLPYYLTEKHGIEAFGRIWQESNYPEDPIEAAARLFYGGDMEKFYDAYYDYTARCVNYDFKAVHQYMNTNEKATRWSTQLLPKDGGFQPTYSSCPGTTGFNVIELTVPAAGTNVKADLKAIAPGSSLVSGDPGTIVDADGNAVGTTDKYNDVGNKTSMFRFGFVAIAGDKAVYGNMTRGKEAIAEMQVPAGTTKLYLVVTATPTDYQRQGWDESEANDAQWPYNVKFEGTGAKGFIEIPAGDPEDVEISHDFDINVADENYPQGDLDLSASGDIEKIAKAFKIQPAEIVAAIIPRGDLDVEPAEGKIAFGLLNPDGKVSYAYSANGIGFWVAADGSASTWGDSPIYFEYDGQYTISYGHKPGTPEAGKTYTMKPCLVYTKGGKQYKATITLNMKY